jgi:hypothetical protein
MITETETKLSFDNVIIELTRRCNMTCSHCLRGDAQNLDMDLSHVEELFRKTDRIHTLSLSGGEPSLVPDKIIGIISLAEKYKIVIDNFYIATNAKVVSDNFIMAVIRLYLFCGDNEISALQYSSDQYHEEPLWDENIRKLEALSFTSDKGEINSLLDMGNASYNCSCDREVNIYAPIISDEFEDELFVSEGEIYLNCKGDISPSCDLSYEIQDELKICSVYDDLITSIREYAENNPEKICA